MTFFFSGDPQGLEKVPHGANADLHGRLRSQLLERGVRVLAQESQNLFTVRRKQRLRARIARARLQRAGLFAQGQPAINRARRESKDGPNILRPITGITGRNDTQTKIHRVWLWHRCLPPKPSTNYPRQLKIFRENALANQRDDRAVFHLDGEQAVAHAFAYKAIHAIGVRVEFQGAR